MLSNFMKRVHESTVASGTDRLEPTDDPVLVPLRPSEHDNGDPLPSSRSLVHVLYPPSYLGIPSPFPDPPSYPAQEDGAEKVSPSISSTATNIQATSSCSDPLAEDPSLTGVPRQGGVPSVEPNLPIVDRGHDRELEDSEPLPAYSRFDQRRPRFPVASDVLGPYPPSSIVREATR